MTLTDQPCDFRTKMMAALEKVKSVEEPWEEFSTAGNRKSQFDHLTKSQRSEDAVLHKLKGA